MRAVRFRDLAILTAREGIEWFVNPTTFRVHASDNLRRGGLLGQEGRDGCLRERAVSADVSLGAREPREAAARVDDHRYRLRRGAEAEGDRVSSIVGEQRCGGGRWILGVLEVVGPGYGGGGQLLEPLQGRRTRCGGGEERDGNGRSCRD